MSCHHTEHKQVLEQVM